MGTGDARKTFQKFLGDPRLADRPAVPLFQLCRRVVDCHTPPVGIVGIVGIVGMVSAVGRGLIAGAVGTAVMTVVQQADVAVSERAPSTVPGQVGAHLLPGRDVRSTDDVHRLNLVVHWAHGLTMGAVRGLLASGGLRGATGTGTHFALLWFGDALLYKSLGIADMPWRWSGRELVTDLAHKGIYTAVTGATYDALAARPR
jgi:hypothetical protein